MRESALRNEIERASAFDLTSDETMNLGWHSSDAAWQDFSSGGSEFAEQVRIGVIDLIDGNVLAAAGHAAIRFAESNAALDSFWFGFLHSAWKNIGLQELAKLAMKCAALKEGVEFHFLQTTWSAQTFLVARCYVAGSWFALSFGFGAFENDDVAWHGALFLMCGGRSLRIFSHPSSKFLL